MHQPHHVRGVFFIYFYIYTKYFCILIWFQKFVRRSRIGRTSCWRCWSNDQIVRAFHIKFERFNVSKIKKKINNQWIFSPTFIRNFVKLIFAREPRQEMFRRWSDRRRTVDRFKRKWRTTGQQENYIVTRYGVPKQSEAHHSWISFH